MKGLQRRCSERLLRQRPALSGTEHRDQVKRLGCRLGRIRISLPIRPPRQRLTDQEMASLLTIRLSKFGCEGGGLGRGCSGAKV